MVPAAWVEISALDEIEVGESRYVVAEGIGLLVHHLAGTDGVRVTSSQCPHEDFTMERCVLHGTLITCIEHGWQFDVRTGACVAVGDDEAMLPTYPVEIREGRVFVKLF